MASVYTVDQVLVKLHLHLTDIPESLWACSRRRPDGGIDSSNRREEILRRLGAGASVSAVARDLRIARSTVRHYRDTRVA
jgi:DNA-binding NarL/FixJ family response regulator